MTEKGKKWDAREMGETSKEGKKSTLTSVSNKKNMKEDSEGGS